MGYEILSDELFDDTPKKPKKSSNKKESSSSKSKSININPLYIHIGLVVILILFLIFFFMSDITFFDNKNEEDSVLLIGELKYFDESYIGSFDTYISNGLLKTRTGEFDIKSSDIEIENFIGQIYLYNNSIYMNGTARKITYNKNILNLAGENFLLTSYAKTNIDLYFKTLILEFEKGRIKLNEEFNYEFTNSTIILNNFNTSFNYDGSFSFVGNVSDFTLQTKDPALIINYKND